MKKYSFLIILIMFLAATPAYSIDPIDNFGMLPAPVFDPSNPIVSEKGDILYQSNKPGQILDMMNGVTPLDFGLSGLNSANSSISNSDYNRMPFFKKIRLKTTLKYREMAHKQASGEKLFKFGKKKNQEDVIEEEKSANALLDSIDNVANIETSDTVSLEAGISEEHVEKQLLLDAANINFDKQTGEMVASGRPILFLPPQETKIIADVMTYDDIGNILKATGDVVIIKNGQTTHADYLVVNLNEETIDADNIFSEMPKLNITAEHGLQKDGLLIFNKGTMYSDDEHIYRMRSEVIGPRMGDMILTDEQKEIFFGKPEHTLDINVSNLEIDAKKNYDVIKVKKLRIGRNNNSYFRWPSMTIYTDKNREYFEANYPELGSDPKMGMFFGPGIVFPGPFGSIMKAVPMVTYKNGFGIGGMLKYSTPFNHTEIGYTTNKSTFILNGRQYLDDNLYLQYAYNSYVNDWFLGGRMPKYIAELVYEKSYVHPGFLGGNRSLTFSHRGSFGFAKENDENRNGEKFRDGSTMSTTRTKYMGQVYQTLYAYTNKDKRIRLQLGLTMQGSAAVYGTGDTQFIARGGPNLYTQYKNWVQNITYYQSGYQDSTPMPRFDAYRYGNSSLYLSEGLRLNKYISVMWQTYLNLSKDAPNNKMFQENAFLVALGPDDLKVVLGYDFIRERTYFGVDIGFNPKGTTIKYDKMIIKNPERLGQSVRPEDKVVYIPPLDYDVNGNVSTIGFMPFNKKTAKSEVLQYATVIELEDPDKERIE